MSDLQKILPYRIIYSEKINSINTSFLNVQNNKHQSLKTHSTSSVNYVAAKSLYISLSIAIVEVLDNGNGIHNCRILCDQGIQSHIITEKFARKLNMSFKTEKNEVSRDFQNTGTVPVLNKSTKIKIQSKHSVTQTIFAASSFIPQINISVKDLKIPSRVKRTDSEFNYSRQIEKLIDARRFYYISRM